MVGKYMDLLDAYKSLIEAMIHAGIQTRTRVNFRYIDSEDIEKRGLDLLDGVDAILVPGGFGERGMEGKITAVCHARKQDPLSRDLSRDASCGHRVRSSCCRS